LIPIAWTRAVDAFNKLYLIRVRNVDGDYDVINFITTVTEVIDALSPTSTDPIVPLFDRILPTTEIKAIAADYMTHATCGVDNLFG
jgi:hypothetical protein